MSHKFRIGQAVSYSPARLEMPASTSGYEVVRLVPSEGGDPQYRIKSTTEPFERIAREGQLKERALRQETPVVVSRKKVRH
jgi:hypothetical protein